MYKARSGWAASGAATPLKKVSDLSVSNEIPESKKSALGSSSKTEPAGMCGVLSATPSTGIWSLLPLQ